MKGEHIEPSLYELIFHFGKEVAMICTMDYHFLS